MCNKLQQSFDSIQATPALKNETKAYLSQKLYHPTKKIAPMRRVVAILACLATLLLGGGYSYFTPVSAISIDVNPSIELNLNCFDRVVSVEGYNEAGRALVPLLSLRHLPYEQAIETILDQEQVKRYLAQGELLSMTVVGRSQKQSQQILVALSQYETQGNISCHATNAQEVTNAHGHGLSVGKYAAYLTLCELNPNISVEEVRHLTMRQIRDQILALSGDEILPQDNENERVIKDWQGGHHGETGAHHRRHGRNDHWD